MSYPSASDPDTARRVMPSAWDEPELLAQDIADLDEIMLRDQVRALRLIATRLGTHIEFDFGVPAEFAADVVCETYGSDPECYWIGERSWSMGVFA